MPILKTNCLFPRGRWHVTTSQLLKFRTCHVLAQWMCTEKSTPEQGIHHNAWRWHLCGRAAPQKSIFFFVGREGELTNFLRASLSLSLLCSFFWKRIVFLIRKLPVSQQLHLLIASVVESLLAQDSNHQKRYVSVGPLGPDMEKLWEISPKIEIFKPDPHGNHSSKFQLLPKVGDKPEAFWRHSSLNSRDYGRSTKIRRFAKTVGPIICKCISF